MQIDELYLMNPCRHNAKQIYSARHVVSFEKSVFRYYPKKLFREIPSDEFGIHTLRGPRQVRKITFLKFYAKRLIEEGVEPSRIFFLTCDGIKDRQALAGDSVLDGRRTENATAQIRVRERALREILVHRWLSEVIDDFLREAKSLKSPRTCIEISS